MSIVGKVFCKIINDRLVRHLESGGVLHEGQAGFRAKRSCVDDNIYVLSELVYTGKITGGEDVQKAYDTVWHNGLWVKMLELGVRGEMWSVINVMYKVSRVQYDYDGECSEAFDVQQGVAQGCSLSPILLSLFINGLLKRPGLGWN